MKTILKVENLRFSKQKKEILKNITFNINEGDTVALIGLNGSGKSSLIKTILGLHSRFSGNIFINSYNIKLNFPEAMNLVGGITDEINLYNNLSGYDNLKIPSIIYETENISIMKLVKMLNLEKIINEKVNKYSLGEKKRLMIARSLINDPNILVIDEIFNNLDIESTNIIKKVIKELQIKKVSILISDHNINILNDICNKYIILSEGKILEYKHIRNIKNLEKVYQNKIN